MLSEIPFYAVTFLPIVFAIVAALAWLKLLDKVLAPPKAPPHVATPKEAAASKARALKMFAEAEASKLAYQRAHHH